jgi:transglutaminase-like putative cysteine protease
MENSHSQKSRWWDWAAVGLLFILLQTLASRLVATTWTPFLSLIQTFAYIGFIIGAALGYSRFERHTVRLLVFFYMLIMLPLRWTLVIDQDVSLEEQLASVAGRLFFSISDFLAREPVEDPFFFVAIMSVAFWIISSWASFALVRNQNYLGAVLPAAIGLIIIQNYDDGSVSRLWFLAFFAFIALLLLGRLQFLQNKNSWQARRIFFSSDNSVDLTSSMAVAAGLIILVAWSVPASVSSLNAAVEKWNRLTKPWQEFSEKMENAVSALKSPYSRQRGEFVFGTKLALGLGFPNSQALVFVAHTPDLSSDQQPPRYYWRGRVYDSFLKGEWQMTGTSQEEFSSVAAQQASFVSANEQELSRFSFQAGESRMSLLYAPSDPVWFSRSGTLQTSLTNAESKEIISLSASPELLPGEAYVVDSLVKNPNRQQLREAGTDYPEWVTRKYLQLPENFSPRIVDLASEITARVADNPYDKAIAITNYLRQNLKYSATIQEPPRNKDTLEWVLFEYKQAYCVYYATSEVLMLRSLGIPARMAVGFTQGGPLTVEEGQRDRAIPNTYLVLRNNAHAWPEVYFPGIGWVEFEPTVNQPSLERPLPPQDSANPNFNPVNDPRLEEGLVPNGIEPPLENPAQVDPTPNPLLYLLPLLAVFAAVTIFLSRRYALPTRAPVLLRTMIERSGIEVPAWVIRWEKWVKLSPIERAFESVNFALRQLDQPVPIHTTPTERVEKLTSILPDKANELKILLDEHQTSLYTSRIADVTQARRAAFDIRKQVIIERIRNLFFGKPLR